MSLVEMYYRGLLYGARTSLSVSATAIFISISAGMTLGAAAGYFGGDLRASRDDGRRL